MSTKSIALIVGLLIIAGGAYYLITNTGADVSQGNGPESKAPVQQETPLSGKGAMASLFGLGSVKCDVTSEVGAISQGEVYIAGNKMRADFTSQTQAGTFKVHMINDGVTLYSWADSVPQGVKLPAPDISAQAKAPTMEAGFDYSAQVDYSCTPWTEDLSVFTPPTSVTFITPPTPPATQ